MFRSHRSLADFEHNVLPRLIAPVLGALLLAAIGGGSARAAGNTFVIAADDGYGIMDCVSEGKACGKIVADAYCESHGLGPAKSFGPAADITNATPVSTMGSKAPTGGAVIACGG